MSCSREVVGSFVGCQARQLLSNGISQIEAGSDGDFSYEVLGLREGVSAEISQNCMAAGRTHVSLRLR